MQRFPIGMDLLTVPPPAADEAAVLEALRSRFGSGFAARVSPLPGERDRNLLVHRPDGSRAVLKLFNAAEPPAGRALARAVLLHLETHPEARRLPFAVPRLIRTLDGADGFAVDGAEAMLTTFVEGRAWDADPPTAARRSAVGRAAAALGAALRDFDHPALRRGAASAPLSAPLSALPWDLMRLDRMASVAAAMADRRRGDALAAFLDRFVAEIRPAVEALPAGAIHNDLNGSNVLFGDRISENRADAVSGVIDFGDLLQGPRVAELAVASTYGLGETDLAEAVADVAAGWAGVIPLSAAEAALLFDLALARLALRVLIYEWRAMRGPERRPERRSERGSDGGYLTRHAASAYRALDRALALPPGAGRDRVAARSAALPDELGITP